MHGNFSQAAAYTGVQQILPTDEHVLAKLVDRDDVHNFGVNSIEALRTLRVGAGHANKVAFGYFDQGEIHAAIYVHTSEIEEPLNTRQFPGDVAKILQEPVSPAPQNANCQTFYSITRLTEKKGTGEALILGLLETFNNNAGVARTTLSPFRGFQKFAPHLSYTSPTDALLKGALEYLLAAKNPVMAFHLKNGAYIADINLEANTPDSKDGQEGLGVLINYGYSVGRAAANRQHLHEHGLQHHVAAVLAPHLKAKARDFGLFVPEISVPTNAPNPKL